MVLDQGDQTINLHLATLVRAHAVYGLNMQCSASQLTLVLPYVIAFPCAYGGQEETQLRALSFAVWSFV